jgi:hypothetical protein
MEKSIWLVIVALFNKELNAHIQIKTLLCHHYLPDKTAEPSTSLTLSESQILSTAASSNNESELSPITVLNKLQA